MTLVTTVSRLLRTLCCAALVFLPALSSGAENTRNVFWSGHSLTDPPIPDMLTDISAGFGTDMNWNRHSMAGATLEDRTRGRPPNPDGWDGYRQGNNRDGTGMDVLAELRTSTSVGGTGYDVLVITESSEFMWSVVRRDAVRLLRHYYENYFAANPDGQAYVYQAWMDVHGADGIASWLDYQRSAEPLWQCMATRVNASLEYEQRDDRLKFLPAGLALAALVEEATSAEGLAGITAATPEETLANIFTDLIHITDTAAYYIALVTHAFTTATSPVGAWLPAGMSNTTAGALQELAWRFYHNYQSNNAPLTLVECSAVMRNAFAAQYWRYIQAGKSYTAFAELPWYSAYWQQFRDGLSTRRNIRAWQDAFSDNIAANPFRFDAETDAGYWHPAP